MEIHQDALSHWIERGFTGAVLLQIDAHSGLRAVAAENMSTLKDLAGRSDLAGLTRAGRSGEGRLYDGANFVRIAAELGVVREMVWITPFPLPPAEATEKTLKDYFGRAGFSAAESGTFRPVDGCFRGRVGEITVRLCGRERLPAIPEPVLLSIDASYFPNAAAARGGTLLTETRELFKALRTARLAVLDAVSAYSVQEGMMPPDLRWVGDMVVQVLRDPAVVLAGKPPERWWELQKLSAFSTSAQPEKMEMLGLALSQLERQPHDPAFLLYAAEAADRHGGGERALAYAEEACRMDRGYCVGLREIGLRFLERGEIETGLRFIASGEKLLPGMEYGQLDMGIALMKAGRAAEALEFLEKGRVRYGAFPSAFLIGAVHLFREDRGAARLSFDAGLAKIERLTDFQVMRIEIAQVIAAAAAFYREEGLTRQAEQLEGDPRLRLPTQQTGP